MDESRRSAITFGVVTMSDKGSRGEREDTSGAYLKEVLSEKGYSLAHYSVIPDKMDVIIRTLTSLVDNEKLALIVTTGGTGVAPTDVTPEAMTQILEKEIPGIAELMRFESLKKTVHAALSRGKAGIRGECLIVNLPGSLKAVRENLDAVLPVLDHAIEKIQGDEGDCGKL